MKPIRKRARLKEMLDARKARRARGGDQVINTSNTFTTELEPDDPLFQEIVQAQGPMPVGEAVVAEKFEPRNREERKVYRNLGVQGVLDLRDMQNKVREDRGALARGVAKGATSGAFEAVRMAPIAGEIIDGAEVVYAGQTGKDFYGDDASATELGAIMGAGLVIPNIIERPLKKLGKAAKKFFKFGKEKISDDDLSAVQRAEMMKGFREGVPLDELNQLSGGHGKDYGLPVMDASGKLVDPYPIETRVLDEPLKRGLPSLSDQSGTQFVRDWYSDPRVRQHFRDVTSSQYKGRDRKVFREAFNEFDNEYTNLSGLDKLTDPNTGKQFWISKDPEIQKTLDKITAIENNLPGQGLDYYGIDVETPMSEAQKQKIGELWDQVGSRQREISGQIIGDLEKKYGKNIIDGLRKPESEVVSGFTLDRNKVDEPGVELERTFVRGRTTPDVLADYFDPEMKRVVSKNAGGISDGTATAVVALDKDGSEAVKNAWQREWERSTAAHEANHDATVLFLGSKTPEAKKIREGLSLAVKPEFKDQVKRGLVKGLDDGIEYYASTAELTARAMEMRRNVINATKSMYSGTGSGNFDRRIRGAFNGIPSEKTVFNFLTGNHDGLSEHQVQVLTEAAIGPKSTLSKVYTEVLPGKPGSKEKREGFRNLMKYGIMATGAAGAYGAMDNQGGQPSNSMYAGGVLAMRKKKKGMSPIRK